MNPEPQEIDLLIVGGGIAGIAIAERAARQAKRSNRSATIVVLESDPMLAMGASSRLQGWYHSGALYCRLDSDKSIRECLESAETLVQNYGPSSDFSHQRNCNAGVPSVPADPPSMWFGQPIDFRIDHPDHTSDPKLTRQMLDRIGSVWQSIPGMIQQAPSPTGSGMLNVPTPDRAMRTENIAHDLVRAAEQLGVSFYTSAHVDINKLSGAGQDAIEVTIAGRQHAYKPRYTIVTVGPAIADVSAVPQRATEQRAGIIVTARPMISDANFAVLANDPKGNFSHITHERTQGVADSCYSVMSDSTAIHPAVSHAQCERVARGIVEKAKDTFGAGAFQSRLIAWHACTKVEPIDSATNTAVFSPTHVDLDPTGRVTAIIPAKFSLFPRAAEHANEWLREREFYANISKHAPPTDRSPAPIAAPLSASLIRLAPKQASSMPTGSFSVTPQAT